MQLSKKDKVLMGVAGGLLVIVIIVYAIYYGGGEESDPITPDGYTKGSPTRATTGQKTP